MAELDGADPLDASDDAGALDASATELATDLGAPARVTALGQLGDGARAQALTVRGLRPKLAPIESAPVETAPAAQP